MNESQKDMLVKFGDVFFNAWCKIMTPPKQRLFCSWHVDRAWRKNLCRHNNQESFQGILEEAIHYMKTEPDLSEFGMYFEKTYMATSTNWAYCYCQHNTTNTNMHLERVNGVIKHIYLKGKKPKRLDVAIHALMRYLRDKLGDRLIHLNKGKLTTKLSTIRQRHLSSEQLKLENVICGDREWEVVSANNEDTYIVKNCKAVYANCKHIDLVCIFTSEKVDSEPESSDTDLTVCEPGSGDNQDVIIKELQNPVILRHFKSLEHKREKLFQQFNLCLNEATSEEACEVISKCLSTLMPTLQAMQSTSTKLPALSSSKVSQFEPQKKFVATKRKWETTCVPIMKPDISERRNIVTGLLPTHQDGGLSSD
ncbi:uncharacterized protein LOC126469820 [Schistocerca serialis cubense]|uniref:uncharacterized protein LOC126469820 n=1 Tax=Schistocerca serialis cubense TaxID=2023355 RepID=UPI00214F3504|nr:uncharacterized protein LOC126469820 [Schistocerca serialis cubense]